MLLTKLSSTWNEEIVITFQPIDKGKYKIYKTIKFFTYFNYFILFWGTLIWQSITENVFMIRYSLEHSIMQMSDYWTKTSIIDLKVFNVGSINYLGWESNLSIKLQKCCLHGFNEHKSVRETYLKFIIFNDFSQ